MSFMSYTSYHQGGGVAVERRNVENVCGFRKIKAWPCAAQWSAASARARAMPIWYLYSSARASDIMRDVVNQLGRLHKICMRYSTDYCYVAERLAHSLVRKWLIYIIQSVRYIHTHTQI